MKRDVLKCWPFIGILILWFAFSSPYFMKGLIPFPSTYLVTSFPPWNATHGTAVKNNAMPDTISQIYPWKRLTVDTWRSGETPLWNPYSFAGTGHAANYQTAIFSPLTILFLLFPFIDAWSILILLQPLVAGIGMYVFLREQRISGRVGAFIGSVAFMFCGFMVGWMAYGTLGWASAALPWSLLFISMYITKKYIFAPILYTLTLAFSFASGHFQISLYVMALSALYIICLSYWHKRISRGLFLLTHAVLAMSIAAPQLLLTFHAYTESVRSESFIKGEVVPWRYIVTLLAPDFYGNPVTRNDWFGHYAEWASYVGVIPLILALFSFVGKRTKRHLFFGGVATVTLLLAYQSPLSDMLFFLKLPAISTSAASRILILTSFSLAYLSAIGFSKVQSSWKKADTTLFVRFSAVLALVIASIWAVIFLLRPFDADKLIIARRNMYLPTGITVITVIVFFFGLLKSELIRGVAIIVLLALSLFDLHRFASKWMPFEDRKFMYPAVSSLEFLQKHAGENRVFGNIGNEVASTFGLQLIEGYDAMYQKRYGELIQAASKKTPLPPGRSAVQFDKHGVYRDTILKLLGVRYIYHRKSDMRAVWAFPYWEYEEAGTMKQVYADDDYWIYEYTEVHPRAFLAANYTVKTSDAEILRTLFSGTVDLRDTVILEKEPAGEKPQAGSSSASIRSYKPNRVEIHTSSNVPKLLFLSDVYDTGWIAMLDGKHPLEVLRANYDFRAVPVPSGDHVVVFSYKPGGYLLGIWLAMGAAVSLILITVSKYFYENRHR